MLEITNSLELDAAQPSTHATRNPAKKIIPPRINNVKNSKAGRATAKVGLLLKKERKKAFEDDINAFVQEREQKAQELAAKHHLKVDHVRQRMVGVLLHKRPRNPNKRNALISRRATELNEGRDVGKRLGLNEIQAIVSEEVDSGKHDNVNEEKLLKDLEEKRKVKKQGARSSNRAATLDYNGALINFREQFSDLYERTGALSFAFFTRGHVLDGVIPGYLDSQQALTFVNDVLKVTPAEVARKFEQWACAKDRGPAHDTAISMRTEAVNMIINGLQKILATGNVKMSYENYETAIVDRFGVVLRGWPEGLKFQSPAKITSTADARMLRDALVSGECIWVKMSRLEKEKRANAQKEAIERGDVAVKQRKKRSDAGKPRGPRAAKRRQPDDEDGTENNSNETAGPPQKKRRQLKKTDATTAARQMPPAPKSSEVVEESDESDEE